jgi:hypothetical protein
LKSWKLASQRAPDAAPVARRRAARSRSAASVANSASTHATPNFAAASNHTARRAGSGTACAPDAPPSEDPTPAQGEEQRQREADEKAKAKAKEKEKERERREKEAHSMGYLIVDSRPPAEIFVDGAKVGDTPLFRLPLTPGLHSVRAVIATGDAKEFTVEIKAGKAVNRLLSWKSAPALPVDAGPELLAPDAPEPLRPRP